MKKSALFASLLAFVAIPVAVEAQNANVQATATIPQVLEFDSEEASQTFEDIVAGDAYTAAPGELASLEITANHAFSFDFTGSDAVLTVVGGEETIAIRWDCAWDGGGTGECADLTATVEPTGLQSATLDIGFHLADTSVLAGEYEGTLSISLTDESS